MKLSGLMTDSMVDGDGIRLTVFFQGCPHHCNGCHNPETWDYEAECNEYSVEDILVLFDSNSILSGITLSGGEPFSERNFDEIIELCKEIKKRKKTVWAFTGYTIDKLLEVYPNIKEDILPYIDVLVDGPFNMSKKDYKCRYRGSNNQRLIDVKKYLSGEDEFTFD